MICFDKNLREGSKQKRYEKRVKVDVVENLYVVGK
jgi:hypothetical protein